MSSAHHSPPTNPLWRAPKVKNYLPDMTHPEVSDLLTRSDVVIIPLPSLEEHGPMGPLGTDFYNGVAQCQLMAQETEALVAPIIMAGNSPYHLGFPGTISISTNTLQAVYFEACQSLIHHGFRKFAMFGCHGGNIATTQFVVDRINQETPAVAVDFSEALEVYLEDPDAPEEDPELDDEIVFRPNGGRGRERAKASAKKVFDAHSGVNETSNSLYLAPTLVQMDKAPPPARLTLPPHLRAMIPAYNRGDPVVRRLFLAEALKAESTGKHTSTKEMTKTGCWTEDDVRTATAEKGKEYNDILVKAGVKFLNEWKRLVPMHQPAPSIDLPTLGQDAADAEKKLLADLRQMWATASEQ